MGLDIEKILRLWSCGFRDIEDLLLVAFNDIDKLEYNQIYDSKS